MRSMRIIYENCLAAVHDFVLVIFMCNLTPDLLMDEPCISFEVLDVPDTKQQENAPILPINLLFPILTKLLIGVLVVFLVDC